MVDQEGERITLVQWASAVASDLLAGEDARLAHVQGVVRVATSIATVLPTQDRLPLLVAAHLHDVGYAAALRRTGLHQLDGAQWAREQGVSPRICRLVAHHSGARFEAAERGLVAELDAFELETGPLLDALDYADMTTGPTGAAVTFEERMHSILARYPADDPVSRAMTGARPILEASIARIARLLDGIAQPM